MMKAEINAEMDILLVCATLVTLCGACMTMTIHIISQRVLLWRI